MVRPWSAPSVSAALWGLAAIFVFLPVVVITRVALVPTILAGTLGVAFLGQSIRIATLQPWCVVIDEAGLSMPQPHGYWPHIARVPWSQIRGARFIEASARQYPAVVIDTNDECLIVSLTLVEHGPDPRRIVEIVNDRLETGELMGNAGLVTRQ